MPECVYIIHISVCRNKIIFIRIAVFCKILTVSKFVAMETKIINILSFFVCGICKSDMGYLDTIYVVNIQLAVKKLFRFEKVYYLEF